MTLDGLYINCIHVVDMHTCNTFVLTLYIRLLIILQPLLFLLVIIIARCRLLICIGFKAQPRKPTPEEKWQKRPIYPEKGIFKFEKPWEGPEIEEQNQVNAQGRNIDENQKACIGIFESSVQSMFCFVNVSSRTRQAGRKTRTYSLIYSLIPSAQIPGTRAKKGGNCLLEKTDLMPISYLKGY